MVELLYRVHGVSVVQRLDQVSYRGQSIKAMVDCLEIELQHATEVHSQGSLTLRFFGDEIAPAKEQFKTDYVTISFDPAKAPSA